MAEGFANKATPAKTSRPSHFEWDGNRLLAEQHRSQRTLYLYETDSFAPLAQLIDDPGQAQNTPPRHTPDITTQTLAANDDWDEDDQDWNPRRAKEHHQQRMQSQARHIRSQTRQATQPIQPRPHIPAVIEEILPRRWQIRYYHNDQIGTPRELTGEAGEILWSATYRAWGKGYATQVHRRCSRVRGILCAIGVIKRGGVGLSLMVHGMS